MGVVTSRSFLLDTHALLWALTAPHRLSDDARAAVADPTTDLVVSAASAWELTTKNRVGKLPQADSLLAGYPEHLDRLGVRSLPIGTAHALLAGRLQWDHRDPFDRMLAAQAILDGLTLITCDDAFAGLPGIRLWW